MLPQLLREFQPVPPPPDHVHLFISIRPKYSVAVVMGFVKGKSAIHIARGYAGKRRNFVRQHFWGGGYLASTVGKDEAAVRKCFRQMEKQDQRLDQLDLFRGQEPV